MLIKKPYIREQRFIRVGRACNFHCLFCNISYNEKKYPLVQELAFLSKEIESVFLESVDKNLEITISGGEPSLFQDQVRHILKELNKRCPIEIQTNASNVDKVFAEDLFNGGVRLALVSFHAVSQPVFEEILQTPFKQFENICNGIRNLLDAGIRVMPNIIVTKINLSDFLNTIHFLLQHFPQLTTYNLGVFQPHGEGEKNQKLLSITPKEIQPYFQKAAEILEKNNKDICFHFCSLPPCFFKEVHKKYVLEYGNYLQFRQYKLERNFFEKTESNVNAQQKIKQTNCDFCYEKNFCGGIWKKLDADEVMPEYLTYKDFSLHE